MKTQVEFTADKFPSYGTSVEGENYDAGIYGKRLAEYLQEKLVEKGCKIRDIFAEDWGWIVELEHSETYPLFIGCSSHNDEDTTNAFLCYIEPSTPYIRKWFKKIDVQETVKNTANMLDTILREDADLQNVKWIDP